jgi:hypothetical protein
MHNTFDALDACPLRFGPHVMRDVGSWHLLPTDTENVCLSGQTGVRRETGKE